MKVCFPHRQCLDQVRLPECRTFFTAALSEMKGKERELACDSDCSPVLERMLYSMDEFVRRVSIDSLPGCRLSLITDRFASHVCQTLLTVAADTVAREVCSELTLIILKSYVSSCRVVAHPRSSDKGELFTKTGLMVNVCEDILSELPTLVHDPFASHVLQALLMFFAPRQLARTFRFIYEKCFVESTNRTMKAVIPNEFDISQ
ncbi:armadillo-type protein [Gautieria morchelliformis]|nr:armadillo-type protein [Gautieria morchelliformis]